MKQQNKIGKVEATDEESQKSNKLNAQDYFLKSLQTKSQWNMNLMLHNLDYKKPDS